MTPFRPHFYDVHWYGPFPCDQLDELHDDPNLVLYMVSGTHGVYGHNMPLYLGMTEQGIRDRMLQHYAWLQDESDPPMVYAAAISDMTCWADFAQKEHYPRKKGSGTFSLVHFPFPFPFPFPFVSCSVLPGSAARFWHDLSAKHG